MTEKTQVIEITSAAVDKIAELIATRGKGPQAVRVLVVPGPGGGMQSEFKFVALDENTENDTVQEAGPFPMYFDQMAVDALNGARVDFNETKYPGGFNIAYPNLPGPGAVTKEWDDPVAASVQKVLDEQINPGLAGHGGWAVLLDVQGDTAIIEMGGGCQGCAISQMTLRDGIERAILANVPEIKQVSDSTDHASGANPYYKNEAGESALG